MRSSKKGCFYFLPLLSLFPTAQQKQPSKIDQKVCASATRRTNSTVESLAFGVFHDSKATLVGDFVIQ